MRAVDLLRLILDNLGRRKARVGLTAVGVVIGTAAVVVLVSLAVGLQRNATEQLGGISDLTRIEVYPGYNVESFGGGGGGMAVSVEGFGGQPSGAVLITDQSLADFAALPGVTEVYPRDMLMGAMSIKFQGLEGYNTVFGVPLDYLPALDLEMQAGAPEIERGTVVIGAMVASSFYNPRQRPGMEPPPPPDLMGQVISIAMSRWTTDGREIRRTVQARVGGVIAETRGESDWSIYMTLDEVTAYNQWFNGRRIDRERDGYPLALVRVGDPGEVVEVSEMITGMGYQAFTQMSFVQGINSFFTILQVIFGGVGAIALMVAAIGIANTMAMSILERTREIGLMKAVGATNRDVLAIFLGEAAGIGFLGGLGGVALGWIASQLINVVGVAYLAGRAAESGGTPATVAVFTPPWLPAFALIFATLVGIISGLYPALRAATLIPVNALKYE
jgi:putative ABC transport system permease protein